MYTIEKSISNEIVINKSKFITKLIRLENKNIDIYIKQLKNEYKGASHYCYAYIFNGFSKTSDDGEPPSTAGLPILKVLKSKNIEHILCVVIRYFGGIKLGVGGLVRAYTNSVLLAINKSNIIEIVKGYKVKIKFSYDKINYINKKLENYQINYKKFDENIIYEFLISDDNFNNIKKELEVCSSLEIIENLYIKNSK